MKALRLFLGSVIVYLLVATLHACNPTMPGSTASGSGGHGGSFLPHSSSSGHGGSTASAGGKGAGGAVASGGGHAGAGGIMNPVPDAEAEESGSRIKAIRIVGADGSKEFAGWYDKQLDTRCGFYMMTDGVIHCVPWYGGITGLYVDASCSVEAVLLPSDPTCAQPKYAIRYDVVTTCHAFDIRANTVYRAYNIGQKSSSSVFYGKSGTMCLQSVPQPGYDPYVLGAEEPPSSFVAASLVTDP